MRIRLLFVVFSVSLGIALAGVGFDVKKSGKDGYSFARGCAGGTPSAGMRPPCPG
jgi:hypothetical protein